MDLKRRSRNSLINDLMSDDYILYNCCHVHVGILLDVNMRTLAEIIERIIGGGF